MSSRSDHLPVQLSVAVGCLPHDMLVFFSVPPVVRDRDSGVAQALMCGRSLSQAMPAAQLDARVDAALTACDLHYLADRLVGCPGAYGLAYKDFVRFVIAAELMANPSVLLCGALLQPLA